VLGSFNPHSVDAPGFGIAAHLVQKHCFANSSKPNQHHAFRRPAQPQPLQADFDILANLMSASKFGWWTAGSGGVGVANWVHNYSEFSRFIRIR
jgi:hypothetical protein